MDRNKQVGGDEGAENAQNQTEAGGGGGGGSKGKSCKGYLYYSSILKSNGTNPRCIGIPRTLQQVLLRHLPQDSDRATLILESWSGFHVPNIVGHSEAEAYKEGRTLTDFYYGCAGYSVYINKDHSTDKQVTKTQLPVCVGLELLVDRRVATADNASASAHVHGREGGREIHQPRTEKPAHASGDDFLSRYTRNASLVASGVARNMRRVGNYIKESLDDILYPYRRRPK